jgi:hypothetical protein
LDSLKVFKILR